ncbi:alpha/beta hydrolase [Mycolicibacterium sp. CBMA 226]|uniref:PHA/PHB synthase family protein n=1 Tax=Mycolicibacterium sp. CBMA 226 TaxID=2606611 RepID=UPI0012DE8034|nr:alpha/beta fold hydrolase [Mycolicibacterium sp. CBMA 226]MUL80139.1 alpha/beta fold hydrolase [Mycolicibacterium sp. CBMA 226]
MAPQPDDVAAPLDELLSQAANGPLRRLLPGSSGIAFLQAVASNPRPAMNWVRKLAGELGEVVTGSSTISPPRGDKRFSDPAWTSNPLLRRVMQAYLAAGATAESIVKDTDLSWRDAERMNFVVSNLVEAASPTNNPLITPVAWKAVIDTGGANLVRGPLNLLRDMASPPRVPSMVDPTAFRVGEDLALTPGSVVFRSEMLELIQYKPLTETVHSAPLMIIPPTINKFYVLDLAPGRSLIEYLLQQGQQVFVISWRNPDERHAHWGFNEYAEAIIEAFTVTEQITEAGQVHVVAACSGGLLACLAAAHRAATGHISRLASLSLLVTMIDQVHAGVASAVLDDTTAHAAIRKSRRQGYLDGRDLAEVFAWLRPSDLIWNYWVNNYLRGQAPPRFDILFWNADTTRMTARLHRDFVESGLHNKMSTPGAISVLGTPIDLGQITVDSYVVAGSADHICPWTNCYRSSQLLGGKVRFVLSTNGHIAALVNPPTNHKSSYQVSDDNSLTSGDWRAATAVQKGSWWPDYAAWLKDRSGDEKPAPKELGSEDHPPLEDAPGVYVMTD